MRKKSSLAAALLALAAIVVLAVLLDAGSGEGPRFAVAADEEAKQEQAAPVEPAPQGGGIVFQGKLYASLKRNVSIPYKGIVTKLLAQAGQQVTAGDPLMRFRLAPEVIADIRRSISPDTIRDIEIRIAQVKGKIAPLRAKLREVEQLAEQKMASGRNLSQIRDELESLEMQREVLQMQLEIAKRSLEDNRIALRESLGQEVGFDKVPQEITLTAPIDGHVLWIHPDIRSGAEMAPGPGLVIGVMDPMIVRAHVFEIEASRMSIGDKASVSLSSIPDKTFEATLSRISWTPVTPGLGQPSYYEVELTAPNPDFVLKEGYKTQVSVKETK